MDDRENIVNADEARSTFDELFQRVKAGEEVTITEGGAAVARMVPVPKKREYTLEERRAAADAMLRDAKGRTLGMPIREAINEGRR